MRILRCWKAWRSELRKRFKEEPQGKLMRLLDESLSLNVQMTVPKAYLAESLPAGMEELMRLYVEPPPREGVTRLRGRAAIQSKMRSEFERAGVWDLLRKRIAASDYTRAGDPLADRCGLSAERRDPDVSCGEHGAGRGNGQGAGVLGGGLAGRCGAGGTGEPGVDPRWSRPASHAGSDGTRSRNGWRCTALGWRRWKNTRSGC